MAPIGPKVVLVPPRPFFDNNTLGARLDRVIQLLEALTGTAPPGNPTLSKPAQTFGSSAVAKTPFQLAPAPQVKIAYLQNISTFNITKGTSSAMKDGTGFILNAAGTAGQAGDTQVIGPQGSDTYVDLINYWFTCNTTGQVLVCDYLQ